jgi:ABC-2 type transport system permease protein
MRDTTQWSQLFLLLALIVVYLYNFKVLPLGTFADARRNFCASWFPFANLALAGFVLSAVAVRFAFPAVSLEGRAFWILQSAPVSLRALVWSKFWLVFVPLLLLGELLIFSSNLLPSCTVMDDGDLFDYRLFNDLWHHCHWHRPRRAVP